MQCRFSALPTELSSQLGAGQIVSLKYTREGWINECRYMKHIFWTADERSNRRKILAVSTQLLSWVVAKKLRSSIWSSIRQGTQTNAIAPPSSRCRCSEHAQKQTQLTPESLHRINTYYASIDKVLSELELKFTGNDQEILCALENIRLSQWNT